MILAASAWFIEGVLVLISAGVIALLSGLEDLVPFAFLGGLAAIVGVCSYYT